MFTGIVQSQAEVYSVKMSGNISRIVIKTEQLMIQSLTLGASIAINGVCLTVVSFHSDEQFGYISFDVIDETLKISNLANLAVGNIVNIERSLKIGDELGGHIVSGHVHTKATLIEKFTDEQNCRLSFSVEQAWKKYILPKGFITVNGISLTVGEVTDKYFNVHLIPETLSRTNLSLLSLHDEVNIECDQQTITIVQTIERLNE